MPLVSPVGQPGHRRAVPQSRAVACAAFVVGLLLVLTGCIRYNMDVMLLPDDQARVLLDLAVQDTFIIYVGEDPATVRDSLQGDLAEEVPPGTTFEVYATDGWTGTRLDIPAGPITGLGDLDNLGVPMQVSRSDGRFYFSANPGDVAAEVADWQQGSADQGLGEIGAEASFTLSCPGAVLSSNGASVHANTVTWDLLTMSGDMTAVCEAEGEYLTTAAAAPGLIGVDGGWFSRWWPVLLLTIALLGGLVALAAYLRRKSHEEYDHWENPVQDPTRDIGGYWQNEADNRGTDFWQEGNQQEQQLGGYWNEDDRH